MSKYILLVSSFLFTTIALAEPAQLPDDVPRVRYSPNFMYSQEGFVFGQNPKVTAPYYDYISHTYQGEFTLGNGGAEAGPKLDTVCAKSFDEQIAYWKSEDDSKIAYLKGDADAQAKARQQKEDTQNNLRQQKADKCTLFEQPWLFSMIEPELYSRYVSLKNSHQTSTTVVGYYFTSTNSAFTFLETHLAWRAWVSESHNIVQKLWYTNADQFKAPAAYTELGGEANDESVSGNVRNSIIEYAPGQTTGYILRASMSHGIRKTYEIVMQEASVGGSLQMMNLNYNPELFDHIVLAMLTGHVVTVHWVQLRSYWGDFWQWVLNYKTNYRITGIEVLPK